MELKYINNNLNHTIMAKVLIVPLWNWNNFRERYEDKKKSVLIVPLWNWNEQNTYNYHEYTKF